jgi:hypothetical protein
MLPTPPPSILFRQLVLSQPEMIYVLRNLLVAHQVKLGGFPS